MFVLLSLKGDPPSTGHTHQLKLSVGGDGNGCDCQELGSMEVMLATVG